MTIKNALLFAILACLLLLNACLNKHDELQPINMDAEKCAAATVKCYG